MIVPVTHHLLRLTCGLGLLLLVAVQEKICTWPAVEVVRSDDRSTGGSTHETDSDSKKTPLTLAATVPDVVAPRWPVSGRSRITLAATSTRALPDDSARPPRFDSDQTPYYAALDISPKTAGPSAVVGGPQALGFTRPQFLSCVWRTAPPAA